MFFLFDLDGTLIDTKVYSEIYPEVMKLVKDTRVLKELQVKEGRYDTGDVCKKFGLLKEYYAILERYLQEHPVLKPDVRKVLQAITKRGKIGIVSNSMKRTIELYVKRYELPADIIFSAADAGYRKDDVRYWKKLMSKFDLNPAECVVIGDVYQEDVVMPGKVGFKTVWVKKGLKDLSL